MSCPATSIVELLMRFLTTAQTWMRRVLAIRYVTSTKNTFCPIFKAAGAFLQLNF